MPPRKRTIAKITKPEPEIFMPPAKPAVSVRMYRRIAATFIALAVLLFVFIVYLSFSKAVITIVPKSETAKMEFSANVEKEPSSRDAVRGIVSSVIIQGELEEQATGELEIGEGRAEGDVVIYNKTAKAQTLVRTTRLLTSDGILFRLDETVVAPAGGSVEAKIYADKAGDTGKINPAAFTIPGLWPGLQDKIYAESSKPTELNKNTVKIVSKADMERASEKMKNELMEEGKAELQKIITSAWPGMEFSGDIIKEKFDVKEGERASEFGIEMELRAVGVFYDLEEARILAQKKLEESISADMEISRVNFENLKIEIVRYDLASENAGLKVYIDGDTILRSTSQIFDKSRLAGLDKESVINYFNGFKSVDSVTIELKPFWLKRVPELEDNIEIIIKR